MQRRKVEYKNAKRMKNPISQFQKRKYFMNLPQTRKTILGNVSFHFSRGKKKEGNSKCFDNFCTS
jgi:hypothetical protein